MLGELGLPQERKRIVPDRPGHDRRYLLDSGKIREELGWRPLIDFETGIRQTIRWYTENRDWLAPLLGRSPVLEGEWTRS